MNAARSHRGFTLLELVLVLMLIGIVLGMAAPSLRGWARGSKLRDASDQFVSVARYARSQAIATGQTHRISINSEGTGYELLIQSGEEFTAPEGGIGPEFELLEGLQIRLVQRSPEADARIAQGGSSDATIDFFPTGRVEVAQVRISGPENDGFDILCATPSEGFRVLQPGEETQ